MGSMQARRTNGRMLFGSAGLHTLTTVPSGHTRSEGLQYCKLPRRLGGVTMAIRGADSALIDDDDDDDDDDGNDKEGGGQTRTMAISKWCGAWPATKCNVTSNYGAGVAS
jgi:hypothetical protein